jgi:hypothetical protein
LCDMCTPHNVTVTVCDDPARLFNSLSSSSSSSAPSTAAAAPPPHHGVLVDASAAAPSSPLQRQQMQLRTPILRVASDEALQIARPPQSWVKRQLPSMATANAAPQNVPTHMAVAMNAAVGDAAPNS